MENKDLNNIDDDKTVFLSSSSNINKENSEKTTINMENSNNQSKADTTQIQNTSKSDQVPQPPTSPINKVESNGGKISGGTFAAGVAAAAVAGTALGATFSDEIKDVFDGNGVGAQDSPEPAAEIKPEDQNNPSVAGQLTATQTHPNLPDTNVGGSNAEHSIEISNVDENGNTYTVSLIDVNGDGQADFVQGGVTTLDGSSIVVTQSSDSFFNSELGGASDIATIDDYSAVASEPSNGFVEPYFEGPIEEVADPIEISDPNEIELPTNEIPLTEPFEVEEGITSGGEGLGETSANYENIDWASFNDAPATIEDSEYGQELAGTDFDNLNNTGDDLNQNLFDPGTEETNNEFL